MSAKKISIAVFLIAAVIVGLSFYPKHGSTAPIDSKLNASESVTLPPKVENISLDYAEAHRQLMKKADEVSVKSF
jgi:hypothetical protein